MIALRSRSFIVEKAASNITTTQQKPNTKSGRHPDTRRQLSAAGRFEVTYLGIPRM